MNKEIKIDRITTKQFLDKLGGRIKKQKYNCNASKLIIAILQLRECTPTSIDMLVDYVYGYNSLGGPDDAGKCIRVLIHKLRKTNKKIIHLSHTLGYILKNEKSAVHTARRDKTKTIRYRKMVQLDQKTKV